LLHGKEIANEDFDNEFHDYKSATFRRSDNASLYRGNKLTMCTVTGKLRSRADATTRKTPRITHLIPIWL